MAILLTRWIAALRKSIEKARPWQNSTGPRTPEGKMIARQNNLKHGYYCREPVFEDAAAFRAFMRSL